MYATSMWRHSQSGGANCPARWRSSVWLAWSTVLILKRRPRRMKRSGGRRVESAAEALPGARTGFTCRRKPRCGSPANVACRLCGIEIDVDRSFRFVADEAAAATLDAESEEDLLVHTRSLDLASLIEDELLLALPLVPRHEGQCPQPLIAPPDPVAAAIAAAPPAKPFASLAGLKVRKTSS